MKNVLGWLKNVVFRQSPLCRYVIASIVYMPSVENHVKSISLLQWHCVVIENCYLVHEHALGEWHAICLCYLYDCCCWLVCVIYPVNVNYFLAILLLRFWILELKNKRNLSDIKHQF